MIKIYCIEDINDLKYVGSTSDKYIARRLASHRCDKRRDRPLTSRHLNLEYCIIYVLEECEDSERMEREKYWINKIDCVNVIKYNWDEKEHKKIYYQKNKQKIQEYMRKYYRENKDN